MADRIDNVAERVQVIEGKVDTLTERVHVVEGKVDILTDRVHVVEAKVDILTDRVQVVEAKVEAGFNAVDAAFLEQRQYIEFSYTRLETKMDAGFGRVERKLDQFMDVMDRRLLALEPQGPARDSRH
jgi:hypothetical protein